MSKIWDRVGDGCRWGNGRVLPGKEGDEGGLQKGCPVLPPVRNAKDVCRRTAACVDGNPENQHREQ